MRSTWWKRGTFSRPLRCPSLVAHPRGIAGRPSRMTIPSAQRHSQNVAVIGAGAAGLVAIRELLQEGHSVTAFEQGPQCGGTWRYTPDTESDILGLSPHRTRVHSSMYRDLRTNLPREIMSYTDFPFLPQVLGPHSSDPRRFPSHREVLSYLEVFAQHYGLHQYIQYNTAVQQLEPLWPQQQYNNSSHEESGSGAAGSSSSSPQGVQEAAAPPPPPPGEVPGPRWRVTTQQQQQQQRAVVQDFDAVLVCNGHYAAPFVPEVEGLGAFGGTVLHSHSYRTPEALQGQRVLVVGASNSGEDICRELSPVCPSIYLSGRSWANAEWANQPGPFGPHNNIHRRGLVTRVSPKGTAEFAWGDAVGVDVILFATGYRYAFPFLEHTNLISTDDKHVAPLYQHLFVAECGPRLSFLGLPWKVVPFPLCEIQAKYVAKLLSGQAQLPSIPAMKAAIKQEQQQQAAAGIAPEYYHRMGGEMQWKYLKEVLECAGLNSSQHLQQLLPDWRPAMYSSTGTNKRAYPETYRDHWDDAASAAAAAEDLPQQLAALQLEAQR